MNKELILKILSAARLPLNLLAVALTVLAIVMLFKHQRESSFIVMLYSICASAIAAEIQHYKEKKALRDKLDDGMVYEAQARRKLDLLNKAFPRHAREAYRLELVGHSGLTVEARIKNRMMNAERTERNYGLLEAVCEAYSIDKKITTDIFQSGGSI